MARQGRLLHFRHVFPELIAPWIWFRRGLLRIRWFFLQRINFPPIWTAGAIAGLAGVILTISLFILPGEGQTASAAVVTPPLDETLRKPVPDPWPPLQKQFEFQHFSGPPVELVATLDRLHMPYGWNDRESFSVRSIPPVYRVDPFAPRDPNSLWTRGFADSARVIPPFSQYREPLGLRTWQPKSTTVQTRDSVPQQWPTAASKQSAIMVEKIVAETAYPAAPLAYKIVIHNPGEQDVVDVRVREMIAVDRVSDTDPPAMIDADALRWELGTIGPKESRTLTVNYYPTPFEATVEPVTYVSVANQIATVVNVRSNLPIEPKVTIPAFPSFNDPPAVTPSPLPAFPEIPEIPAFPVIPEFPPEIIAPPMPVTEFRPIPRAMVVLTSEPPKNAKKGDYAVVTYYISNIGTVTAENIELVVDLPDGLLHRDLRSTVRHTLAALEPGATHSAGLVVEVLREGEYELRARLQAGEIERSDDSRFTAVTGPPPLPLEVKKPMTQSRATPDDTPTKGMFLDNSRCLCQCDR